MSSPINFRSLTPQKFTDMMNPNKAGMFMVKLGKEYFKIEKGVVKALTEEDVPTLNYTKMEMNAMLNPNKVGSLQVILAGGKLYSVEKGKPPVRVLDSKKKPVVVK